MFPPGMTVRVSRRRCTVADGDWPPKLVPEEYDATVVLVGPTGMVYLKRDGGAVGVVHPEDILSAPTHAPQDGGGDLVRAPGS